MPTRRPLVLIPQHFGCLVFERRTSRYLPFDHEATDLLRALCRQPVDAVLSASAAEERAARTAFVDCFYPRGFFDLEGRLDADVLDVAVPADHLVGPLAVHLEVVAACNLTCVHCFAGTLPRHQHPLSVAEMDHLFGELAALGSFRLGLTGGEPLLRKDLFEILDAATERGLHPCLTTNALLLTEHSARELGRRPLVWLNVSLEGPDAATNDPIRGAGTFDAVCAQLRLLRRHARFTLAFTILQTNAHLVRQCAELACELGAHTAVFRPLYPAGTALDHLDLLPTFAQYRGALRELADMDESGMNLRGLDVFGPETRAATQPMIHTTHACGAGQYVCSVSVQGDVNPCSFLGPGFQGGNVRQRSFAAIWNDGAPFRRLRQPSAPGGFDGGCRARAQVLAGSAEAADPWFTEYRGSESGERSAHPGANLELGRRARALPLVSH
jgi:radical SAM protein with 4Fe4S-binding SPASM domain